MINILNLSLRFSYRASREEDVSEKSPALVESSAENVSQVETDEVPKLVVGGVKVRVEHW